MSLLAASFLYLLPLWTLGISLWLHRRPAKIDGHRARWLGLTSDDVRGCAWPHVQETESADSAESIPAAKVA